MNSRIVDAENSEYADELQRLRLGFDRADSIAELIRWRVRVSAAARDALFARAITLDEWHEINEHLTTSTNERARAWMSEPGERGNP